MSNIDWSKKITADDKQREAEARAIELFKVARTKALAEAVVVTTAGKAFDADEQSIGRMGFRLKSIEDQPDAHTVGWVLADSPAGHKTPVTKAELQEAFALAVSNMDALWGADE